MGERRESPITEAVNDVIRSFIGVRPRLLRQTISDLRQTMPRYVYTSPATPSREREQAASSTLMPQAPLPQLQPRMPIAEMIRRGETPLRTTLAALLQGLPKIAETRWMPPKLKQPNSEEAERLAKEEAHRSRSSIEL